jgi:hypothetical protein rflaF_13697
MKYKKILSAILSIMVLSGVCSCGKDSGNSSEKAPEIVGNNEIVSSEKDNDSENPDMPKKNPDDTSVTTTASSLKSDADKTTTTAAKGHIVGVNTSTTTSKKTQSSPTSSTSAGGNSSHSSAGNPPQQPEESSPSGETAPPSGGSSISGDTGSGGNSGVTEPSTAPPNTTAEDEYTAEVTLGSSPSYIGNNVSVEGSVVKINAGGDYIFTGSVSGGQIYVNTQTEEKVTLILNGVDISNPSGPAIFIDEAKKCTIKIKDGSVNSLSDGGMDKINDGVIFSNDTLRFKGSGTLNITSGNAHGIASDDDVIIENGTYNITSIKSGIFAHDDITVNGGNLDVKGGTNGIKSKGTININGGYSIILGGTKEEKSSIYSAGAFNYSGGSVFAAGNKVSVPTGTDIPYIVADLGTSYDAGSEVEMVLDGVQMASFTPHNNFKCLMMLAPEISVGSSFYTVINGNASESNTVNDIQNIFNIK